MKTILVIESEPEALEAYRGILTRAGYQVITAHDGDVGINMAIGNTPHLILCNAKLATVDGFCVLAVLSKNMHTAQIPFLLISLTFKLNMLRRGMNMGADDFITRPFQDDQLLKAVEFRINKLKPGSIYSKGFTSDCDKFEKADHIPNMDEMLLRSNLRRFKKKQTLYFEGDNLQGVYFLEQGCIKTFRLTHDGRALITNLHQPKSFVGLGSLLTDGPLTETAEALENCTVYFVPKKTVLELLGDYPNLNQYFIRILSVNLKQKEDQLAEMAYESVTKRLSKVLLRLNKSTYPIYSITVTRDDLAGLTGIATETVSRILSDFKHQNLIEKSGNLIQIIDSKKLDQLKN